MIDLSKISTKPPAEYSKKKTRNATKKITKEIGELVETMYAEGKHSLLMVVQGMDSSGKDGSTREVFKYCSPTIVSATSLESQLMRSLIIIFYGAVTKQRLEKARLMCSLDHIMKTF